MSIFLELSEHSQETPAERCFTGHLPQRTLSGRPVQHDSGKVSYHAHAAPRGMGVSEEKGTG